MRVGDLYVSKPDEDLYIELIEYRGKDMWTVVTYEHNPSVCPDILYMDDIPGEHIFKKFALVEGGKC